MSSHNICFCGEIRKISKQSMLLVYEANNIAVQRKSRSDCVAYFYFYALAHCFVDKTT